MEKYFLHLSGGVDSSVAAGLLIQEPLESSLPAYLLTTVFSAKTRAMRSRAYSDQMVSSILNFIRVNAQERYYNKLAGVTEPEAET